MSFIKEWKDSKKMQLLHALITMFLVLLFMGIYIDIPSESYRAMIYTVMLIWAGIIAAVDVVLESNWMFAWAGWGDRKRAIPAFVAGIAVMSIIVSTKTLSLSAPILSIATVTSLSFLYTVLAAPYIEEKFFRGMGLYTCNLLYKGLEIPFPDALSILTASFTFAVFHGFAYNWEITGLTAAFIFSIFACIGNQYFKSGAFSFGAHLVNNLLVFIR